MIEGFDISTIEPFIQAVEHHALPSRQSFQIPVSISQQDISALIDSGAAGYFIHEDFVKQNGLKTIKLLFPILVRNVDNSANIASKIREKLRLSFTIFGRTMEATFLVTNLGRQTVILGLPWLERENPDINWTTRTLQWRNTTDIRQVPTDAEYFEPIYNLAISFIRGIATEETRQQWNESRMNKATLFTYEKEKDKLEAM